MLIRVLRLSFCAILYLCSWTDGSSSAATHHVFTTVHARYRTQATSVFKAFYHQNRTDSWVGTRAVGRGGCVCLSVVLPTTRFLSPTIATKFRLPSATFLSAPPLYHTVYFVSATYQFLFSLHIRHTIFIVILKRLRFFWYFKFHLFRFYFS